MDSSEMEHRRRFNLEQYLDNERLNETRVPEQEPSELDINAILNEPRRPHIIERLTYFLVLATLVLCVVNYSGPYLVYLKMAYGFHADDLVFQPNGKIDNEAETLSQHSSEKIPNLAGEKIEDVKYMESPKDASALNLLCSNFVDVDKFDCHPENNASEQACLSRGCCWKPVSSRKRPISNPNPFAPQAPVDVPFCYYPQNYPGYQVKEVITIDTGFRVILSRDTKSYYPRDITTLYVDVKFETATRLHLKIYDPVKQRFEVPLKTPKVTSKAINEAYEITLPKPGESFNIVVKRKDTGKVLLNTTGVFIYSDQFIQFSYTLPSKYIYGLGEHRDSLLHSVNWTRYTMWTKDARPTEGENLYGDHPFYLLLEEGGYSHGVFLLNSNAMDVILQPSPAITWRTIGGIIDLYIFLGPSPDSVVQQYTQVIGQPFMPPYWSLGFHQCRWGYKTVEETLAVVDRLKSYKIPQDVQWNDIDYARNMLDFTTGTETFGDQSAMVDELHKRGLHYVMIVDPAISSTQPKGTYPPFDTGVEMDVFIKDHEGKILQGQLWTGVSVWPDFTNPQTQIYWSKMVETFHQSVKFDGMWIDMNEPVNFVNGAITGCPIPNDLEEPPYVPAVKGGTLRSYTLCASSQQYLSLHYNVHNLYGLMESNASYIALKQARGKRPFVISRSTYPGQGHYGGHWNGDNNSTFYDMYKSISAILSMNMFGIPMVGSDICGFRGNATAELCRRWQQLGAFYPFARNHNNRGNRDQDPGSFGESVATSSKKALEMRYSLLPYLYTLFHISHISGSTVARPLFFEFSTDPRTYTIDSQFLWGPALLISPVLKQESSTVEAYFPKGLWYNLHTGETITSAGQLISLPAPLELINLHVRAGFILPTQSPALTTTESRQNGFELKAYLDEKGESLGELYWDDGDTLDTYEEGLYNFIKFQIKEQVFHSQVYKSGYVNMPKLGSVTIYGVRSKPLTVTFNGQVLQFSYENQVLSVSNMSGDFIKACVLTWK